MSAALMRWAFGLLPVAYSVNLLRISATRRDFSDVLIFAMKNNTTKHYIFIEKYNARWSKKSNEINGGSDASAMRTHMRNVCQSEPELYKEKEDTSVSSKKKSLKKGSRISSNWQMS